MSTPNISIDGTANFSDNTVNNGVISSAFFTDLAVNSPAGSIETATFSLSSINQGAITSVATFNDTAVNSLSGTVAVANFNSNAVNEGSVTQSATFNDNAANAPTASVAVATFNDGAVNQGTISLSAFFNDTAVNSSTASVAVAVFTADTINEGVVTGNAVFEGNASNSGSGVIQGDAIFADTTSNLGTVSGTAQVSLSATNSGTVSGGTTTYEHLYQYDNYYADDSTLANGTILYTGQYTRTLAINVSFSITGYTVTTDGSGLATLTPASNWYDDSSSAARTLTYNGTITQSDEGSGVIAADFNGGNNYITTVATGSEFDFTSGDVTIEFWFKPTSTAFQYLLLGIGTLAVHLWPGNQMTVNDGSTPDDYFGISLDVWQHFAVVISNNSRYVYLNGSLVATSTQLLGATTTLYIGSENGYNNSANYNGKIAGLRIVKGTAIYTSDFEVPATVLTNVAGTELLLNFGATAVPIVAPVIVSHPQDVIDAGLNGVFSVTATGTSLEYQWQYSQDNGSTWNDLNYPQSGSNTDTWNEQGQPTEGQLFRCRVSNSAGTVYSNTASITSVNPNWYDDTSSTPGTVVLNGTVTQADLGAGVVAASFNDNGTLNANFAIGVGSSDFSLAAFVKFEGGNGREDRIFNPDTTSSFAIYRNTSNQIELNNVNVGTLFVSNITITDSNWHYIYAVQNQGVFTIYIDGISRGSTNLPITYQSSSNNYIGGHAAVNTFVGKIAGLHLRVGTIDILDSSIPTSLPTSVAGTELLLNFGGTAVPGVSVPDPNKTGAYSDGYFISGVIDTSYSNSSPTDTIDAGFYTYIAGIATVASGRYANGYYDNGAYDSSFNSSTPTVAIDDGDTYYVYSNGSGSVASGAYYSGFYENGTLNTSYTNATPQSVQDANAYYTYLNGSGTIANGYYSTGYYSNGLPANIAAYGVTIDTGLLYVYNNDAGAAYTGMYSGLYYVGGVTATGYYSTGYYTNGSYNYNAVTTPVKTLDTDKWVTYLNGNPSFAQGTLLDPDGLWYTYDNAGGRTFAAVSIATEAGNYYYRYDGVGGRAQVYLMADNDSTDYYFNSAAYGVGSSVYTGDGNLYALSTGLEFGDLQYSFANMDGVVTSILDTDPYN